MFKRQLIRWLLVIRVITVAIWIQFAVVTKKLPRILETIESKPRKCASKEEIDEILRLIASLAIVNLIIIRKNCLKKNLLYYDLLVTSGVTQLALHIGIRKPNQHLDGHCWLTLEGKVYLDSELNVSEYTMIYSRGV